VVKFLKYSILFLLLLSANIGFSQQERSYIREGNKMFKDSNYLAADSLYFKALKIDSTSFEAKYNLVNSQLKQGKNDISIKGLNELTESTEDKLLKSKIFHNLGNAHTNKKEWDKAVDAYKNALRNNPNDKDTRYNYAYAKRKLAQENQQKKDNKDKNKDKQDKKDKDKKDKGDKKEKDEKDQKGKGDQDKKEKDEKDKKKKDEDKKKEGDKKDGNKEDAEDKNNKDKNGTDKKKPQTEQEKRDSEQKAKAKQLKRKQAEQILRQLDKNEKNLQQKMIRAKMKKQTRKKIDKDW
tara:strand:+ start:3503 stop:4384 length:882 start_codon:yes stop_codon:yes gene_type:complete